MSEPLTQQELVEPPAEPEGSVVADAPTGEVESAAPAEPPVPSVEELQQKLTAAESELETERIRRADTQRDWQQEQKAHQFRQTLSHDLADELERRNGRYTVRRS